MTAWITPAHLAKDVDFVSEKSGVAWPSPTTATSSQQRLTVTGARVAGETTINALDVDNTILDRFDVVVYPRRTVDLAVHVITPTPKPGHPPGGCLPPNPNTSAADLISALNNIWDQAAIQFTMQTFQHVPVDFDLNENCVLDQYSSGDSGPERQAIVDAARDPNAHINIYYVPDLETNDGTTISDDRVTFIENDHADTTENLTAHEIGHSLGLRDVTDPTRLMLDVTNGQNPCFLNKSEWDTSNAKAGTF